MINSVALPFFHAVTGCDTVSYFAGKGKKTAFQVWKSNPEVTDIFRLLSSPQDTVSEEQCRVLGRFVVLMYSRTCPHQTVNEARQALFAQGNKSIENIPPTQAVLAQHIKRAAYQAGHSAGAYGGTPKSGRVGLAAITRRLVSQVDYAR